MYDEYPVVDVVVKREHTGYRNPADPTVSTHALGARTSSGNSRSGRLKLPTG